MVMPVAEQNKEVIVEKMESNKIVLKDEKSVIELSDDQKREKVEKAQQLLKEGKTDLICNRVLSSTEKLGEACSNLAAVYGDTHFEMCEYYYNYGCAMYELAQMEEDVLGAALDGVPSDEKALEDSQVEDPDKLTETEKEDVANKVQEAIDDALVEKPKSTNEESKDESKSETKPEEAKGEESKKDEASKSEATKTEDSKGEETKTEESKGEETKTEESSEATKDKEEEESKEEAKADAEESQEEGESEDEAVDESQDDGESGDEDSPGALQLSFEVLDLARTIYLRQPTLSKSSKITFSQVYCKLGYIELEHERVEDGIKLFNQALEIQNEIQEDSEMCRDLAATHFNLFNACLLSEEYDRAEGYMNKAVDLVEQRKISLQNKLSNTTENTENKDKFVQEIKDCEIVKSELKSKLEDVNEMKSAKAQQRSQMKELATQHFKGLSENPFNGHSSDEKEDKPASIQIRKKRKPEDEGSQSAEKKPRTESTETAPTEQKKPEEKMETSEKVEKTTA